MSSTDEQGRIIIKQSLNRLWRYLPVLLWVIFIFSASGSGFSFSNTSRIVRPLLLWLFPAISEGSLYVVHYSVRKAAHVTEYAMLALLLARAFLSSSRTLLRRHWFIISFLIVSLCALLDEFHQSFVNSRIGSIYDCLIDMVGCTIALGAIYLWRNYRVNNRRQTPSAASTHAGSAPMR